MVRSKVKLAYIKDDAARRTTFKKRTVGLMKKVSELSTLCGVDACAIVFGPYDPEPDVWPLPPGAQRIIERFRQMSEYQQGTKMMNQESFTRERIAKTEEKLIKLQKENHDKEVTHLMFSWMRGQGASNLTPAELREIGSVADEKIKEIEMRILALKKEKNHQAIETRSGAMAGNSPLDMEIMHVTRGENNPHSQPSYNEEMRLPLKGPIDPIHNYQGNHNMDPPLPHLQPSFTAEMKRLSKRPMDPMQDNQTPTYNPFSHPQMSFSEEMRMGLMMSMSQVQNCQPKMDLITHSPPPLNAMTRAVSSMPMSSTQNDRDNTNPLSHFPPHGFEWEDTMVPFRYPYNGDALGSSSSRQGPSYSHQGPSPSHPW